ncbi:MAG: hypothetical protein M1820_006566 [Bogoriella megaspora]|nr:MAG: hypothetical protein M1820_006566 [Bogoriella megaspora]
MPSQTDLVQDCSDTTVNSTDATEVLAEAGDKPTQTAIDLHRVLMETTIANGKLLCGACGHEYAIKEGIANFLLPSHMV